jgi:hypothetical protein
MDFLNAVGSICSILALIVSLFVAQRVLRIENNIDVKGDKNLIAGRDISR